MNTKGYFAILLTLLFAVNVVNAQNKRELKEIAKREEVAKATTKDDGSRFFISDIDGFSADVRDCRYDGKSVLIDLLVWNNSTADANIAVSAASYAFKRSYAEDDLGNEYIGMKTGEYTRKITFKSDRLDPKYIHYATNPQFVPIGAPLRITLCVNGVNSSAGMFRNVQFTVTTDNTGGTMHITNLTISK